MKQKLFMLVDGNALLHRAWHALPPLATKEGEVVNAVYGFAAMLFKALKEFSPTYCAIAFDKKGPTFRHDAYDQYKAGRTKQPDEFYNQFDRVRTLLEYLGIPQFEVDRYEADDIIATVVRKLEAYSDVRTVIVTGDMDALQLVSDSVEVLAFRKGISDIQVFDKVAVQEKFNGLLPHDLLYYKALRGDVSDNIPGVKGVGEKTAIELVRTYHTLDELYTAIEEKGALTGAVREKLLKGKTSAYESLMLVDLVYDLPFDFSLEACELGTYAPEKLVGLFQELGFKSLLARLPDLPGWNTAPTLFSSIEKKQVSTTNYQVLDNEKHIDAFLEKLEGSREFAFDTEATGVQPVDATLLGMSFACEAGQAFYLPWALASKTQRQRVRAVLESETFSKIGHNIKYDVELLCNEDIRMQGVIFDTMIAAYVLHPGVRDYSLDSLAFSEFGYQKISIETLIGRGVKERSMEEVPLSDIGRYACEDADFTYRLYAAFSPRLLAAKKQQEVFETIEMPLIPSLIEMELNGVKIDVTFLGEMKKKIAKEITGVKKRIYQYAGEEFNIGSPLQLKGILFEKLAIPTHKIRKGKTGLSTAASELEKMRTLHPIIEDILQYRELSKLDNTYVSVLPNLVSKKTGRVHTNFNQTIAATGRLSSSNPNVQNIPIRQGLGSEIRKSFVAEKGYTLIAADYSQMELRIAASIANDAKMIQAFRDGQDIHTVTAAEIHGISPAEVTAGMRHAAKEINFGVMYGMGPQGLAESAGISYGEAVAFIDQYFAAYPAIRTYMDTTIAKARKDGYVETLFGRRRYIPELVSAVAQIRNGAERMAINMPIQGTEADIIKFAMISLEKDLSWKFNGDRCAREKKKFRMILQVHDELVFEVRDELVDEVLAPIKAIMEGVIALDAPLVVDMKIGANWGDMTKQIL